MKTYDEESERFWATEEAKEREIQSFDKEYPIELKKTEKITILANDQNKAVCFIDRGDELKSFLGEIQEYEGSKYFYGNTKTPIMVDIEETEK
jgi:hypothetical protein